MSRWLGIKSLLRSAIRPSAGAARASEEFRFHLDMETERNIQRGMSRDDARRAAVLAFGGVDRHVEEMRDGRGARWAADMWADVRYAARTLMRSPGFVLTATITLGLGVGANGLVFGTVDGLLFRPMPVERSDRLVALYGLREPSGHAETVAYEDYLDYRDKSGAFADLAVSTGTPLNFQSAASADMVWGDMVSENYFTVLQMRPALGRFFAHATAASPTDPVVVLSYDSWQHRFAGDPTVVGREVRLNGTQFTIVGVAPKGFHGVRKFAFWPEMWVPLGLHDVIMPGSGSLLRGRGSGWATVFGRMHDGWTMEQTQAAASAFARALAADYQDNARRGALVIRAGNGFDNPSFAPPRVLMLASSLGLFAVGAILVIVCANLANLLLARAASRRQELAIRLSLGCSRSRLVRQLLVEAAVLAVPGAALGMALIFAGPMVQDRMIPRLQFRVGFETSANTHVVVYTFALSLAAVVLFGLAPALGAARSDIVDRLKSSIGEGPRRSRHALGMRGALVVVQLALSVVLLCGGALFTRSLIAARLTDLAFDPANRIQLSVNPDLQGYSRARGAAFYRDVLGRVRALPSVANASWGFPLPFDSYGRGISLYVDGLTTSAERRSVGVQSSTVDCGFFGVVGIRLMEGREFGLQDSVGTPLTAIVNRSAATRFWPGVDAVGRRARLNGADGPEITVVGVVADAKFNSVSEAPQPHIYLPLGQQYIGWESLVVQLRGSPTEGAFAAVRSAVTAVDPTLPTFGIMTMDRAVRNGLNNSETAATLAGVFGLVALLIASVGLYGLVANFAAARTREIGVRIALGATRGRVASLVIGRAAGLAGVGIALGLAGSLAAAQVLRGLLVGLSPRDPVTFIAVPVFLVVVVVAASYLPARRASRLDPARVLRS